MIKNRYLRILLLPFLAVVFLIGFTLTTLGESNERKNTKQKTKHPVQNSDPAIEIGVLIPQQEQAQTVYTKTKEKAP